MILLPPIFAHADGADNPSVIQSVPGMTSDTAPSGTATYSSAVNSSYYGWKAFDRGSGDWLTGSGQKVPSWVGYQYTEPKAINKGAMLGGSATRAPTDYRYQASATGSWAEGDYVDLTEIFTVTASSTVTYWHTWKNSQKYLAYRIYITGSGTDASYTSVDELTLVESQY